MVTWNKLSIVYKKQEGELDDSGCDAGKRYINAIFRHLFETETESGGESTTHFTICKDGVYPRMKASSVYLGDGMNCTIKSFELNSQNELSSAEVVVESNYKNKSEMLAFLESFSSCHPGRFIFFTTERKRNTTYINEKSSKSDRAHAIANADDECFFRKQPFLSDKTFQNVFGFNDLFDTVSDFSKMPRHTWYQQKGLNYQLNIALKRVEKTSGNVEGDSVSGTGSGNTEDYNKYSRYLSDCVKAIAKQLDKNIFHIDCSKIQTTKQLLNLFTNSTVECEGTGRQIQLNIPIGKRLYVLDNLADLPVCNRKGKDSAPFLGEITLDDLQAMLRGDLSYEQPGRIILFTGNFGVRGITFDHTFEMKRNCTQNISKYIEFITDKSVCEEEVITKLDGLTLEHVENFFKSRNNDEYKGENLAADLKGYLKQLPKVEVEIEIEPEEFILPLQTNLNENNGNANDRAFRNRVMYELLNSDSVGVGMSQPNRRDDSFSEKKPNILNSRLLR